MTGFGRGQAGIAGLHVGIEIKSVNHRFMDTRFKIPIEFLDQELIFKKKLSEKFKRGSFDIFLNYKIPEDNLVEKLDKNKIKKYISEIIALADNVSPQFSPTDFLRSEFYLDSKLEGDQRDNLISIVHQSFDQAAKELYKSRYSEGERLVVVIKNHLNDFKEHFSKIEKLAETYQEHIETKLKKRFHDLKNEFSLDENRFYQEVIYYLEKLDIHEEINRINSHLVELTSVIEGKGEVGRKIEFLLQELNRETNTIGSKAGLKEISESVIPMKVHLEKIREQALNLE